MRLLRAVLVGTVAGAALVSCVGGEDAETAASTTSTTEQASTTTTAQASTSTTEAEQQQLPAGPYYLPALPVDWEITTLRFFAGDASAFGGAAESPGVESVSLVVHRTDGGFAGGGATLTVTRSADGTLDLPAGLGFGESESLDIPGALSAQLEYDDLETSFGSVVAQIDEQTTMSLFGDLARGELIDLAGALRVGDSEELEVELDLAGWVAAPGGNPGENYLLGLRGPEGSLEVSVQPGVAEASLYLGGSDFESSLEGDVGFGYYAVQRIESEDLEFPRVHWWVPSALLTSSVGPDLDVIAEILDGFFEVGETEFRSAIAEVAVEIIDVESDVGADGDPSGPESEPLAPDVLDRLIDVVELAVGREFDERPVVSVADGAALRAAVPDGSFVSEGLWNVLLALGLVDLDDSRTDADAARRDRLRGVCCPVTVVDTGDPLFNEVVIVHELTHGLDTELGSSGSASVELIDPSVALVEGNAHRVAFDYADELNRAGADLPPPPSLFPPEGDPRVPPALQRALECPYREGLEFAVALAERGGEQAIVDAFRRPPASTEQIMNPDAYVDGSDPVTVAAPTPPSGVSVDQQGTIGAFLLSLAVEPAVGADTARDLALSWDGDAYIVYEQDGQSCLAATMQFDSAVVAEETAQALIVVGLDAMAEQRTVRVARCAPSTG